MSGDDFPIGPFTDYEENPILSPRGGFQSKRHYNPTVIEEGGIFYMLYRAETDDGLTGRIGLAESHDGFHFACNPEPVLTPDEDFDRGGCEDPRIVKFEETYYLTYVGNSQRYHVSNICLAASKDLLDWTKHGSVLSPRDGSWNSGQLKAGVIAPEKINGRYVMYFMGEERAWIGSMASPIRRTSFTGMSLWKGLSSCPGRDISIVQALSRAPPLLSSMRGPFSSTMDGEGIAPTNPQGFFFQGRAQPWSSQGPMSLF